MPQLWQTIAANQANLVIRKFEITDIPVCPFTIAQRAGIQIQPIPAEKTGASGMLLRFGEEYGILYATHIDNEAFQRFSVAHELGHYFLEGHPESVLMNGFHASHAGFGSIVKYELEADHFAAALLMPRILFNRELDKTGKGFEAIEKLADQFNSSLTATAIQYAQSTEDAVAVIVSIGTQVDYCFMSKSLNEVRGLAWLRKNTPLPARTLTREFNKTPENISHAKRLSGDTDLQCWFGGDLEADAHEEVIGLGSYGKTLTVITINDLPEEEELEEEEDLVESWTPRFKR